MAPLWPFTFSSGERPRALWALLFIKPTIIVKGAAVLSVKDDFGIISETTTLICTQTSGATVTSYQFIQNGVQLVSNTGTSNGKFSSIIQGTYVDLNIGMTEIPDEKQYGCTLGFDTSNTKDLEVQSKYIFVLLICHMKKIILLHHYCILGNSHNCSCC